MTDDREKVFSLIFQRIATLESESKFMQEFKEEFKKSLAELSGNIDRLTRELERERVEEQRWTRKEIESLRQEKDKNLKEVEKSLRKLRFVFIAVEYPKISILIFLFLCSLLIQETRDLWISFIFSL